MDKGTYPSTSSTKTIAPTTGESSTAPPNATFFSESKSGKLSTNSLRDHLLELLLDLHLQRLLFKPLVLFHATQVLFG